MNWSLLFVVVVAYTAAFFLSGLIALPGQRYLKRRFQEEFGIPVSEEALALLSEEQQARWDQVNLHDYVRTPFRWIEVLCAFFHLPSILLLGALLKRDKLNPVPMYLVDAVVYVPLVYFLLK